MPKVARQFLILGILLGSCLAVPNAAEAPARKPNIIFILADDLGIGNVSCYGADNFKTPNVDSIAKSGLRFERCYASPLCAPSRATLMTGCYGLHTGMTGQRPPASFNPANETMMPEVLKPAGYVTGMVGKWSQLPLEPSDWGFDEYLRFIGSGKYWNTQDKNSTYTVNGKETPLLDGEYLPDIMNDFVVDFITRHKNEPFYLYYSMSHVHISIMRTPDSAPDSKDLYHDNVAYMDKLVGKLLAELDRLKLRDNTLIVFAGDNGTAPMFADRSTIGGKALSGSKGTMLEGGALVPCVASWPEKIPAGKVSQSLIDFSDFLPTFAAVAGAELPKGSTIDGKSFASQLGGKEEVWPRDWIFVQLEQNWYVRDSSWKLNESNELFEMRNAPFDEILVPADKQDDEAHKARKHLQTVLDQLNPAAGKFGPGGDSEPEGTKKKKGGKKGASQSSEKAIGPEE